MRRVVDLSHPITADMTTYPGLPGPTISDHLSRAASAEHYAPGVTFQIGRIEMVGNTGTYLDSPFHRLEDGTDLAGLDVHRLVDVPGVVVDATEHRGIDPVTLDGLDLRDRAVLFHTGWSRLWGTPAYGGSTSPFLSAATTERLVAAGPALVGIDSVNIDNPVDPGRPAHSGLLGAGIPIVEHLCRLGDLPPNGFRFTALPAPVVGFGTFPVRAVAVIEE